MCFRLFGGELVGGEMTGYRDKGSRQLRHIHVHIRYTSTYPLPENRKDENRKMWKLKDVKIVAADIVRRGCSTAANSENHFR